MSDQRFGLIDVEEGRAAKGGPMPDGDASPPRCATCKHWEPDTKDRQIGICDVICDAWFPGENASNDAWISGNGEYADDFMTRAHFGCTLHEPTPRPLREDPQT